ncbi:uncharacterized protein LOC114317487 [Camellia sinensis]|uniref:uncharacterized protein LOC114317487 n=1 Tax=Camellia sinensis TaxID=4442 RepID=UPI0010367613|nr:uncharacterized protein LOC114317487 [Camellia sinensis]
MSSKTVASMKWHAEGRTNDGIMRHPADSMALKTFDSRYVDFSFDSRNVRLGLAADGFNPYGNMSTSYSIWPVILVPCNLPPWMCMKRSFFILSLLIPGPSSSSNDIDVYMQPLVEELKELWDVGEQTYDISSKEKFQMHTTLMWTINDFSGYGDLSGWNTKGALACPSCNYETHSRWLKHGRKYCFMGQRHFLDKDHRFCKDRASFDGKQEIEPAPDMLAGFKIMMQTEDLDYKFRKTKANEKNKKRKKEADGDEIQPWKKRSIFFTLSYWTNQKLRHNLDVMYIEKNVIDNVYGTLLNLDGKTKDNLKARLDLQEMGIRRELHPQKISSNKIYLPPACFSMILKEKDDFLKVLKGVKIPDGYASNISRCIQLRQHKIIGLKSFDGHILMQQLLLIALRGALQKQVASPLIELSCFFREICSKVLQVEELDRLASRIVLTLCNLERIFPPSFFTVMVHLVVHLATKAKIASLIHYRWMYPIERYLQRLKSYVCNKAHLEGSIVEGYIAEECLIFCLRYLESVEIVFNRPLRNVEVSTGAIMNIELDQKSWILAHRYVLFNNDEIQPYRIIEINVIILMDPIIYKVVAMDDTRKQQLTDEIKWLAQGPNTLARRFKRYVVNGFKFRIKNYEAAKKTQNNGVCVATEGGTMYYGVLFDIIELNYFDKLKYVLFKCNWADVNIGRGYKIDEYGFNLVKFSHLIDTGERLNDEPFVLSSQASQVYYVGDVRHENWLVVVKTKARDVFDVGTSELCDGDIDTYYDNEPYNMIVEDTYVDANENLNWARNDTDGTTINIPLPLDNQLIDEDDLDEDV